MLMMMYQFLYACMQTKAEMGHTINTKLKLKSLLASENVVRKLRGKVTIMPTIASCRHM